MFICCVRGQAGRILKPQLNGAAMTDQNQKPSNPNKQDQNSAHNPQSQTEPGQKDTYSNYKPMDKDEPSSGRGGSNVEKNFSISSGDMKGEG